MHDDSIQRLFDDRIQFVFPRLIDSAIREFADSRGLDRTRLVEQGVTVTRVLELLEKNNIRYLNVLRKYVTERFHVESADVTNLDKIDQDLFQFLRELRTSRKQGANPLFPLVAKAIEQSLVE